MATENPYAPPRGLDTSLLRDVLALALVLAGVVGLSVVAFAVDWRAGVAWLSAVAITTGVYLGYER